MYMCLCVCVYMYIYVWAWYEHNELMYICTVKFIHIIKIRLGKIYLIDSNKKIW